MQPMKSKVNETLLPQATDDESHLSRGRTVMAQEAQSVELMATRLDSSFTTAVNLILACEGRVIVTGIGKSGHIARKIAATLMSTGTPAFFLHPAEGVHGDLGMLQRGDLIIAVSKSGSTTELEMIFPTIQRLGLKSIVLTGQMRSALASKVDVALDCSVETEACPHNLAPTSSATCALVMGDALAIAALQARKFTSEQFANLHPAGSLGQRLLLRVRDKMHIGSEIPVVLAQSKVRDTIFEITGKRLGCAIVVDAEKRLLGMFTDGDLRRLTARDEKFLDLPTSAGMTPAPKRIEPDALLNEALELMEKFRITALPVVTEESVVCGVLHLHDILDTR